MSTRPRQSMLLGLSILLGASNCQMTMTELKALNPSAATLEVHCHPSQIPDHVQRFAVQRGSGHIVTDEQQDELRNVAPLASVFIEVNPAAPGENARVMASDYGLSCPNVVNLDERSPEPIRNKEPCSTDATSSNGPTHSNLVADVGQPPCDSSGQSKEAKKTPVRVKVCVRPSWVPAPYTDAKGNLVTVNEWAIVLGNNKVEWTDNPARYAEQIAKNADVIFTLDESAPLESAYYFTKDPKKLSCAGGPPKKSYDDVAASGTMPMLSEVTAAQEAKEKAKEKAAAAAKQGGGTTTSTSGPDGSGPPLDPFETVARELVFAGKLATTDTSAPATTADGSRHGMPGGKNVGGFSFPALQAGVGLVSIVIGVGMKPQEFIKKVIEKTGIGKPVIVKELNADALKLADELIQDYGQYVMAEALRKQKVIMPYGMASKFTAKLEAKFQAHKIFERRAIKEVMRKQNPALSGEALEKAVDEVAKTYPAIILTDAEHTVINTKLAAAWKANEEMTKEELRAIYKIVYQENPHWMDAIESFLR